MIYKCRQKFAIKATGGEAVRLREVGRLPYIKGGVLVASFRC